MAQIINRSSKPREYWITFLNTNDRVFEHHGPPSGAEVDSALTGTVQLLDYGVALWGYRHDGSRTVIPWHRVLRVEEIFWYGPTDGW